MVTGAGSLVSWRLVKRSNREYKATVENVKLCHTFHVGMECHLVRKVDRATQMFPHRTGEEMDSSFIPERWRNIPGQALMQQP